MIGPVLAKGGLRAFLIEPLRGIAENGRTPADEKLELFHGRRRGSVDPIFAEFAY